MPPINLQLVQNKVTELNATGMPGAPNWIATDGLRTLTGMNVENEVITFTPNNGIPLKVFVNTESGEIKIFDARKFI